MDIHIKKSFQRMSQEPYASKRLFSAPEYDWPGDMEGRALLAYCRLYDLTGEKIPAMDAMMRQLPEKTNQDGYFGPVQDINTIDEQQLSGNGWFLRGLLAHYRLFQDSLALEHAKKTVHNLFLPALAQYSTYPIDRGGQDTGAVYGNIAGIYRNWRLSTDIGCAFIPLDGLADYYCLTKDTALKDLLADAISQFVSLDKVGLSMQTHATLTATRGILQFYEATKESKYLQYVKDIFELYVQNGMTATYENYNWFGTLHTQTWTEPCAVVDSMILALELFRITEQDSYRVLARRIWLNGLQFCFRPNGGAGPNSCVDETHPILQVSFYDADQCCTMRYAEGLYWYNTKRELLQWQDGEPVKELDRYYVNDRLLVQDTQNSFPDHKHYTVDDMSLIAIPLLAETDEATAMAAQLRVVF